MRNLISTKFSQGGVHLSLLLLRLGLGLMLLLGHGWSKLLHFTQMAPHFSDPLHIGSMVSLTLTVFSEVFCAAFVVLGLFTRLAVIPMILQMIVIVFMVHAPDGFMRQELPAHYLIGFLVLLILGPCKISIDGMYSSK